MLQLRYETKQSNTGTLYVAEWVEEEFHPVVELCACEALFLQECRVIVH
jgi:hypothetical protein